MLNKQQLLDNGFELKNYPDGDFYVLFAKGTEELFVQVSSDFEDISIYEFGWVENGLTEKELKKAINAVNNYVREFE